MAEAAEAGLDDALLEARPHADSDERDNKQDDEHQATEEELELGEDPTIRYDWQRGDVEERRSAIERRRMMLAEVDLTKDVRLQREWMDLLNERNLIAVEDQLREQEEQAQALARLAQEPQLAGWLQKLGTRRPRRWNRRWFNYNPETGVLQCFQRENQSKPYRTLDLADMARVIATNSSRTSRFQIVMQDGTTWDLKAPDMPTMTMWMDELLMRQQQLREQALRENMTASGFAAGSDTRFTAEEEALAAPPSFDESLDIHPQGPLANSADLYTATAAEIASMQSEDDDDASEQDASELSDENKRLTKKVQEQANIIRELQQKLRKQNEAHRELHAAHLTLQQQCKEYQADNTRQREVVYLLQEQLSTHDRELAMRDTRLLQANEELRLEKEARERERSLGLSAHQLQMRLAWVKADLSHHQALIELYHHRLAGATACVSLYRAIADGMDATTSEREETWMAQLADADHALLSSKVRADGLQEQLNVLQLQSPDAGSSFCSSPSTCYAATPVDMAQTFDPARPRYDQTTFQGRFRHFMDIADPRCLAPSLFFGMSLDESVSLMEQWKTNAVPASVPAERLWLAKKIRDSAIHPDTGETIVQPFRMSGFAIYGTPIVVGMLLPNPTIASTIFWQSLNQTHNACVNYANRNASQATEVSDLVTGYIGAVASSVSIAVGLNQLVKRARISEGLRTVLSRFVPYPAVASASTANMLLMRRSELKNGIAIKDDEGSVVGFSQKAAERAIYQTMLSRVVLPAPLLLIPPMTMMALGKTGLFNRLPRARMPVEATVCVLAFVFGLPFAISLFPQEGSITVQEAEPQFRGLQNSKGQPVETFYFNKGL